MLIKLKEGDKEYRNGIWIFLFVIYALEFMICDLGFAIWHL
jgi:hypothetical protein